MILQTKNITKRFGGLVAVNNCSIGIEQGKITSLIGPNGAGKTTLFNIISGMMKPDSGSVILKKEDITALPVYQRARKGISRTFQMTRNFNNMTIRDNLTLSEDFEDKKLRDVLKRIGVEKPLDTKAGDLSYGQQKLLELARALLYPHQLLLLDEPAAGVNPKIRQELKKLLKELKKAGATVLVIEHDMDFVMDISDDVICLAEGKILAEGKPKEIRNNSKVLEAYLGK